MNNSEDVFDGDDGDASGGDGKLWDGGWASSLLYSGHDNESGWTVEVVVRSVVVVWLINISCNDNGYEGLTIEVVVAGGDHWGHGPVIDAGAVVIVVNGDGCHIADVYVGYDESKCWDNQYVTLKFVTISLHTLYYTFTTSVLKSSFWTNEKLATKPNWQWLWPDYGCGPGGPQLVWLQLCSLEENSKMGPNQLQLVLITSMRGNLIY